MTSFDVIQKLKEYYCQPEWAFFEEVPNGTGGVTTRRTDAIAFNLWPSRGYEIIGFEVKVSRADWLNEKKNPKKAEEGMACCDTRILVTSAPEVAMIEEIPLGWGYMTFKGDRIKTLVKPAREKNSAALNRAFLMSVVRRAYEMGTQKHEIERAYNRGMKDGAEDERKSSEHKIQRAQAEARSAIENMENVSKALGFQGKDLRWVNMEHVAKAYELYSNNELQRRIEYLKKTCRDIAEIIEKSDLSLQ